jgi:hypothetical protein
MSVYRYTALDLQNSPPRTFLVPRWYIPLRLACAFEGISWTLSKTEMKIYLLGGCSFQAKNWLDSLEPCTNIVQLHVFPVLLTIAIDQI